MVPRNTKVSIDIVDPTLDAQPFEGERRMPRKGVPYSTFRPK